MIQIVHTQELSVEIDGIVKTVRSIRFPIKQENEQDIFKMFYDYLKRNEEQGYKTFHMYSMWTQHEGEWEAHDMIIPPTITLWVRGVFS
jgi:hypothetical protein